jgi:predicted aconitase
MLIPPMTLRLSESDRAMLGGDQGEAAAMAMRIMARAAAVMDAPHLIDVCSAHIDGCLYHGQTSLDFVERLVQGGGRVRVPTTLNVGSIDLIHPELFRGSDSLRSAGRKLMEAHLALGCESSFTCAPYQLEQRPRLGEQIAWAESNAIVFANSVLGARTNRYGDFIDLCAAITGRAPYAGLHVDENRYAQVIIELPELTALDRDLAFALIGLVVGARAGSRIPVLVGLPADASEDELKALGAASASTGAVAMFHAVGVTPEAPTLAAALGGRSPLQHLHITLSDLNDARRRLNQAGSGDQIAAVSVGTPHFSLTEFDRLIGLLALHSEVLRSPFYVNTSRFVLWQLEQDGRLQRLKWRGIRIVTDTCTYITPIIEQLEGVVMTNSGKMAHYAPSNIGVRLAFGSLAECVRSAVEGRVMLDE